VKLENLSIFSAICWWHTKFQQMQDLQDPDIKPGTSSGGGASALKRVDVAIACVLAVSSFFVTVPFAAIGLDPHHDGIMLKPALDVADGQVLFRDTFSQYGPLTTFLHAVVLKVSPTLLALKVFSVAADAVALGIFYLVWRSILPRSLAAVSAVMFVMLNPLFDAAWPLLPWSSDIAMAFQAIAWLALVQTIVADCRLPWAVVLGAASAAVFWCRQPVGLSLVGTLGFVAAGLFASGWPGAAGRRAGVVAVLAALGGIAAVSGAILGYLWANDALAAWWFQNIVWPRRWAVADSGGFLQEFRNQLLDPWTGGVAGLLLAAALMPSLTRARWPELSSRWDWVAVGLVVATAGVARPRIMEAVDVWQGGWWEVIGFAVVLLAICQIVAIHPRFASSRPGDYFVRAGLAAVALASLTQLYPLLCRRHAFWAVAPAAGVAVYAVWRASGCRPAVLAATLLLALIPNALVVFDAGCSKMRAADVTLLEPESLRGMKIDSGQAAATAQMAGILRQMERTDPSRLFTMIGKDALPLACVKNRTNLTPMYVTWPGLMSAEQEADWSTRFDKERPFLICQAISRESRNAFITDHAYRLVGEVPELKLAFLAPAESAVTARP